MAHRISRVIVKGSLLTNKKLYDPATDAMDVCGMLAEQSGIDIRLRSARYEKIKAHFKAHGHGCSACKAHLDAYYHIYDELYELYGREGIDQLWQIADNTPNPSDARPQYRLWFAAHGIELVWED